MTDSNAYSSLFALVDSHLSKTSVQDNEENTGNNSIKIPSFSGLLNGSVSESSISLPLFKRLPAPPFKISESPIQNVLAEQVANMLKAKEIKKQEEEKLKLEEEMRRLKIEEEKKSVIDLTKAIQTPYKPQLISRPEEALSGSSSCESLFNLNFKDDDKPEKTKTPEPLLPCITDMSYILSQKIKTGKGSSFGKVLTSRLKPVAAPYLRTKVPTTITRFPFDTPSPCDILKEKLRKPTMSCTYTYNICDFVS